MNGGEAQGRGRDGRGEERGMEKNPLIPPLAMTEIQGKGAIVRVEAGEATEGIGEREAS
jgi:hypothetical protein